MSRTRALCVAAAATVSLACSSSSDSTADGSGGSAGSSAGAGGAAGGSGGSAGSGGSSAPTDPGTGEWDPVPRDQVAEVCGLDPDILEQVDQTLGVPWGVVRYGRLCHEFYPNGDAQRTEPQENWSATKTLGALVVGIAAYQTRDLERTGPKTGPISDVDRVDHWLDDVSFNPDAQIGHVLGMVAHNPDLSEGAKEHSYDAAGDVQINRLSDILNTAFEQDPAKYGANLEEFTQRYLYDPVGMRRSTWSSGEPNKVFGFSWASPLRDMMRVGLLMLNEGMWNGERVVDADWIYKMIHPSFEDANTGYGYLTWLSANSNYTFGGLLGGNKGTDPLDPCMPPAIWQKEFPHGAGQALDCNYDPPHTCEQQFDVGVWNANGAGGQIIVGMKALDMVLVVKDLGNFMNLGVLANPVPLWTQVRPAVVAEDPTFAGDEDGFCAAYGAGDYAPDLR